MPTVGNTVEFIDRLRAGGPPFLLRKRNLSPQWPELSLHEEWFKRNPTIYALCAIAERVNPVHYPGILFVLLNSSRRGFDDAEREKLNRVAAILLAAVDPDLVLTVFLALRRQRANHQHARRAILRYIFSHPQREDLVRRRRSAVIDCVEHALGRNVARACAKKATLNAQDPYVLRELRRFSDRPGDAGGILRLIFERNSEPAGSVPRSSAVPFRIWTNEQAASMVASPTTRGDISATLVHVYRGGANNELQQAVEEYVDRAVANLPRFSGTLAIILDASASMRGYGDREFACISQGYALWLVLQKCADQARLFQVGGSREFPPQPSWNTDLASALLDAVAISPDLVVVVSDGYENLSRGDLARVAASLPGIGVRVPVVFCNCRYSISDDLTLRHPAPALPELSFWHENEFVDLLTQLFAYAPRGDAEYMLRDRLSRRLDLIWKETPPWITL